MSIIRDSWVNTPRNGEAKVNAALAWDGVPLLVQTAENLITVRIGPVAVVDFDGFKGVTDELGGVPVNNKAGFESTNLDGHHLAAGPIYLSGTEALAFVRERDAFADGDFQRARNQQAWLAGIVGTALSKVVLTNPMRLSDTVGAIAPFLALDSGADAAYIGSLGLSLRELRPGDITMFTMPTAGTGTSADGQAIVNVDWDRLALVHQTLGRGIWHVRYDIVDPSGSVTLCYAGKLKHFGIGRPHARLEVICLAHHNSATVMTHRRSTRRIRVIGQNVWVGSWSSRTNAWQEEVVILGHP